MRLEVRRLCEFFTASIKRTNVRPITSVDSHVSPEIEIQTKPFTASLERALKRFLACVDQLVPFELGAFDKSFAAFRAHVHPWTVRVQMFAHRTVVTEHLRASLMGARDRSLNAVHHRRFAHLQLMAGSRELGELLRI